MIPDSTMTRALNAYYGLNRASWTHYTPQESIRMRAALEAVAAEIWDDGEEAGLDNALWEPGYEHCHVKNPYRASEDA